jgi:hypothetical protein
VGTVADALSRVDINNLKIQEEEELLKVLSGSETNSISNQIPSSCCLDLQRISKSQGIKREELSLTSLLNTAY